ncbi:MAG: MBL fold metallo-hydrolase [Oscillospiraceae bacterium]|nr:MBL fold metallo-hydrolase [Oscillospiraceae bacterium]
MTYNLWKRILSVCLCLVLFASLFPGLRASAQQGSEVVVSSQANNTLRQLAEELSLEIGKLPTSGALRNCRVLLTGFTQTLSGSNDMKDLRGKHYLIRTDGKSYVLDGSWTGSNGNLPMKAVTVSGYSVTSGASPATAFDFHYRGLASNGRPLYVLRFNNGRNLGIGTRYTDWPELYYVKADTTTDLSKAPTVMLDHPNAESWFRISNATGTHGLRQSSDLTCFRWKDNSAGDNEFKGNVLELYRLWSTREIITAIHDMRGYLEVPEFYDEAVFSEFLTCMRQAIDLFKQYNPTPNTTVDPYDFVQEKLDQKEAELRSFASRLNLDFQAPSAAELDKKTTIHQLPLACGYVIRTREGKIIIIDGGWQENNTEGKYLFSYLQKITGDSTPHIDAWFITHAHADHHGCVPTFADLYKNQVTIDAFYYHYPTYDQIKKYLSGCGVDDTWGSVDWIPTWLMPNFRNAEGGPTKGIICNTEHSGLCNNSFDFDEVHIDILLTFDDVAWAADNVSGRYSGTSANEGRVFSNKTFKELLNDNFNETSMVFRVTVGGKNVLFTGDINYIGGYMLDKFHTAYTQNNSNYYSIKSDYVQVSHHGHYGLPKKVYNKIDPDVALWPCNYDEWNDYDYQNLICTKQWFSDMGAKNYIAYQGPQVFEFPLVRTEGAITVPAELKDYVFDAKYYRDKYADLAKLYGNDENKLYYHFLSYGIEEGRSASPFFDVRFYANQNGAHLRDTFKGNYVAAFKDFLNKYKTSTLMKLSENFDAKVYAAAHKDLAGQGYTTNFALLKHYTENGYKTGEIASTTFRVEEPNTTWHDSCTVTQPVAPTCSTVGKTAGVECTACGLVLKSQTVVLTTDHAYSYKATKNPTASATGTLTGTCNGCSGTNTVTLPKLNTTDYTKTTAKAPTCTEKGTDSYQWKTTTYGTFTFSADTDALGHSYTAKVTAPTCTTQGYTTHTCSRCNHSYTDSETAASEHDYSYKATKNPTASATGTLLGTCSRCGDTTTVTLPKLNTTDYTKTTTKAPTCTETGTDTYKWNTTTYGSFSFTATTEAKGHTVVIDKAVAPSCNATGLTEGSHCSECNEVLTAQTTIAATDHSYTYKVTKNPTYTLTGTLTGTCASCERTTTLTLPKLLSAEYNRSVTKEPTCTTSGIATFEWTNTTYGVFSFTGTIAPMGHTSVIDKAVEATCTETGLTEGKHCSVCNAVLTAQEVISATGHSYTYTKIDDQSHTVGCKNCSLSETAPHSYENGLCICGAEEVKEPVLETGWKLGHTLNLASDISVNLAVSKSLLAGFDMDTVYILAEIDLYTGNEKTGTKTVKLLPVEQGNYYYFTLSGLTAINMNDRIRSVLYGTKDDQEYFSPTDDYSIADYAYSQMNKSAAVPDKLKVLCAELLRYGAKAQIYKNYRVNELADSHMTDAHKALLSDIDAVVFGNTNKTLDDLADASVKWIGKSLILDSKVCLKFIFSKGTYAGDVSELSLHVSYTDTYGATKETVLTVAELYNEKLSYYSFTLDTMLAAELRSVVSVQVYSGNTPVSATLQYSADTYGNGKTGNLLQLCKALIAYSDSANAFFTA